MTELDPDDIWAWWRTALANPSKIGTPPLLIHPSEPHCGYYRVLPKGGNWEPVGIYPAEEGSNQLNVVRNDRPVAFDRVEDTWVWCCRSPVSFEEYDRALNGGGWEDEQPKAAGTGATKEVADPIDALQIEYDAEAAAAREILEEPIKTRPVADRASQLAVKLISIAGQAKVLHDVEKAPSLREGRRIDDKWRDITEGPAEIGRQLKRASEAFLKEEERKEKERVLAAEREAQRKRDEARRKQYEAEEAKRRAAREAERIRLAAEQAAREAEQRAKDAKTRAEKQKAEAEAAEVKRRADERAAQLIEEAAKVADVAEVAAGMAISEALAANREAQFVNPSAGRKRAKVSLYTVTSAVIEDWEAMFAAVKGWDEVKELFQRLADRAAKGGNPIAGTSIVKDRRAR